MSKLFTALGDPKLAGVFLIALVYFPEKLKSIIPTNLRPYITPYITSIAFIRAFKAWVGFGLLRQTNNKLSQLADNNWKSDEKFILSQEFVLITGGASGIGELIARDFSARGVKVAVLDRNAPKNPFPSSIWFYQVDISSPSQIATVASEIRKGHGDPTVLINNAGIGHIRPILKSTEEDIRTIFGINTMAHFFTTKEFLPAMIKENHGHVVTVASMAAYIAHGCNTDYACTKASAVAFHEGLQSELKHRYKAPNVRATLVNPSWVRTPLVEHMVSALDWKNKVIEPEVISNAVVKQILSGRSGQILLPKEIYIFSFFRAWPSWVQIGFRDNLASSLIKFCSSKEQVAT